MGVILDEISILISRLKKQIALQVNGGWGGVAHSPAEDSEENRMTESEGLLLSDCADLAPCFL